MANDKLMEKIAEASTAALLRVAKIYHERGQIHQAISAYLRLIAQYPRSESALIAVQALISIAHTMEAGGMFHSALSVYDLMNDAAHGHRCNE